RARHDAHGDARLAELPRDLVPVAVGALLEREGDPVRVARVGEEAARGREVAPRNGEGRLVSEDAGSHHLARGPALAARHRRDELFTVEREGDRLPHAAVVEERLGSTEMEVLDDRGRPPRDAAAAAREKTRHVTRVQVLHDVYRSREEPRRALGGGRDREEL